jgi:hypothetical protein
MIKMRFKIINVLMWILILIVLSISIFLFLEFKKSPKAAIENVFFSEQPENWVYDNPSTIQDDIRIDSFMASEGKLRLEKGQQNYLSDGEMESFFYSGLYGGEEFKSEYLPEGFFNQTRGLSLSLKRKRADELAKMQITNEFVSGDSVVNGFVLAREENSKLVFYIFVDEDWRNKLEYTNILWGDDFKQADKLNLREFDFSRQEDGVYIDKLETDVDWYKLDPVRGGIIVGEIDKTILSRMFNEEDLDVTYMMVR